MKFLYVLGFAFLMTMGVACGTTFTAGAGQDTSMALKTSAPGRAVIKIDTKVACTVNASGPLLLNMTCEAGTVPWYVGNVPTCIDNPCIGGTALAHNPDATVSCQ